MKIARILGLSLLLAFVLSSCADKKDPDYYQQEQNYIDNWVAQNLVDSPSEPIEKFSNGMYVQWLSGMPSSSTGVKAGNWIKIKYTGYNLKKEIFVTRDKGEAEKLGFYSPYTNYDSDYVFFSDTTSNLTSGQIEVLKRMSVGESVRIIMPSRVAMIGSSNIMASKGYGNGRPYDSNPVMIEMTLENVISNADTYEGQVVNQFVANNGGDFIKVKSGDTVEDYLMYKILDPGNTAERIKYSDEIEIYYEVYFAENDFLLSTNVKSLGEALGRDVVSYRVLPYSPSVEIYPSTDEGRYIYFEEFYFPHKAISRIFQYASLNTTANSEALFYESEFVAVFKSSYFEYWLNEALTGKTYWYETYWYESDYNSVSSPAVVLPFTPLYVKIKVLPKQTT